MSEIKETRNDIAASIYMKPCTEAELLSRDFLKGFSLESVQRLIMRLEKDALYYKGEVMYIRKDWARKNLGEYELE